MSSVDEVPAKKSGGDEWRNLVGFCLAGLAALTLLMAIVGRTWDGAVLSLVALALTYLLTRPGKDLRERYFKIPGLIIAPVAVSALMAAMSANIAPKVEAEKKAWAENGPTVLAKARRALELGDHKTASQLLDPYAGGVKSNELRVLQTAATALRRADGDSEAATRALMGEVAEETYDDDAIELAAAQTLHPPLAKKLAAEQASEAEYKQFRRFFRTWDGSHPALVDAVKATMKNPDSFEHDSTQWAKGKDGVIDVLMSYRGTNSFGAVVPAHVMAVVSQQDGRLLSWKPVS